MSKKGVGSERLDKIYERYSGICVYCDEEIEREEATGDHFLPTAHAGCNHQHNILLSCLPCNRDKGDMHPLDFLHNINKLDDNIFDNAFKAIEECLHTLRNLRKLNKKTVKQCSRRRKNKEIRYIQDAATAARDEKKWVFIPRRFNADNTDRIIKNNPQQDTGK